MLGALYWTFHASCVTRINHESHLSWQAQYSVKLEGTPVALRNVNDVPQLFSKKIVDILEPHFSWQAHYLGML